MDYELLSSWRGGSCRSRRTRSKGRAMAVTFRFGLHFWELPLDDWRARVRRYDALGFSSITFTDHLVVPQWEPIAALAAVAGVTERIRVGTLVVDNGLR